MAFSSLGAQVSQYSMERIGWINPWTTTSNTSGLTLNESFLGETPSFTEGALSGYASAGELKNIYDPASTFGGNFDIGSYLKLGDFYLKGDFEYDYSLSHNSRWRGWYDPYSTPFMTADSIPGNLSLEQYRMGAAIAYPVNNLLSFGLDLKYDVGIMAKHRDLRNKNTIMRFEIAPSIMFSWDNLNIGLNLGYRRETEKVEYKQEDSSSEKYLFSLYGLWLYYSTGFSSAETSRENISSGYSGGITADFTAGELRIFNHFSADYTTAMQGETGYNNLLHGETNKLTFSDHLTILYGYRHKVNASAEFYTMVGNRFLQRQELDPQSNIRIWVTYGGPINYYFRKFASGEISYTYRQADSFTDIEWEATAGIKGTSVNHKYKETPLTFNQSLNTIEGYLRYTHYISIKNSRLDISPEISYAYSDGNMNNTENGQDKWQLNGPLQEEYLFWQAPKIRGQAIIKYHWKSLFFKGMYSGDIAVSGALKGRVRHAGVLSVGFAF